jgi:hypothetical protein
VTSMQTTLAAGAQRAADNAMRAHVQICVRCRDAKQRKRPGTRCDIGQELAGAAAAAAREVKHQKELDAAPNPAQSPLFPRPGGDDDPR